MYFYDPLITIKVLEDMINAVKESKADIAETFVVDTETIDVEGAIIEEDVDLIEGKCEE